MTAAEDFRLGDWLIQPSLNRLSRGGESVSLQPRFMDLLAYLAQRAGKVVSKEEILDAVWAKEFVAEGTLTHAVAVIRQALGDEVRNPRFIETIPTRGYRLIAPVTPVADEPPALAVQTAGEPVSFRPGRAGWAVAAALLVLVCVGAWGAVRWLRTTVLRPQSSSGVRVVVMPFQNLGPPAREYVALGMTDDLTTRLAAIHGIVVSSRTSAAFCAKEGRSVRQIADELGVRFILEGTVRWDEEDPGGPALRVNVQLIRAEDDTLLWAQSYRAEVTGVVELGALMAENAITALGVPVRGAEETRLAGLPTEDPDAYQAFLCGMRYHDMDGRDQLGLATSMFDRAVRLDPGFALAYAELSLAHSRIYGRGIDPTPSRLASAEQAAAHALELRPALPEAHLALGAIRHLGHRDFAKALAEYDVAARDLPNDSELFALIADVYRRQGRWAEARAKIERAVELDPTNYGALLALGDTLGRMRGYQEADRAFQKATGVAPDRVDSYVRRFWNYLAWDGGTSRAEAALAEAPLADNPEVVFCRAYARYLARDFKGAVETLSLTAADAQMAPFRSAPRELWECRFLDAAGDRSGAERACAAALAIQEHRTAGGPSGPWLRLANALACAALGRRAEAEKAAREAAAECPVTADAFDGAAVALLQAQVLARVGDPDEAAKVLERLLSIPSPASVAWLRLEPSFDPLRALPRFQALLGAPAGRR